MRKSVYAFVGFVAVFVGKRMMKRKLSQALARW